MTSDDDGGAVGDDADDDEHATNPTAATTSAQTGFVGRRQCIRPSVRTTPLGTVSSHVRIDGVDPYVRQLSDAVHLALPGWLRRCVLDTALRAGAGRTAELVDDAERMVAEATPAVLAEFDDLLSTDVDAQRTNPLSVLRSAVRFPTAVLHRHGIAPRRRDDFAVRAFPADVYGLSPATWADLDETLQEPGLIWGAWKAKTVIDRRRSEGQRPG